MFNIKQFVNRITDTRNEREPGAGENSAAYVDHEEQHSAEGFLCPPCMKAFPSAEALEEHYNKTHVEEVSTPDATPTDEVQLLREEIQNLQFTLADEKASSAELKNQMLKIQADLNAKDVDTTSLRSQEKEFEESKSLLTSEVTLLRQQLAESLEQISLMRKEKEAVNEKMALTAGEKDELTKEIASLQAQLSHKNSIDDAEVLRQELVSVQKMMNEMSLEKQKEIEILNDKLNEAQKRIDVLEPESLREQLDLASIEVETLKQNNNAIENERNDQLLKLMEELSLKETKILEVEGSLQSKEKKTDMLQQECDQLKTERDRLREQHAELCSKIETGEGAKAALDGLQKENDVLKKELDAVQSQNRELNRQIHNVQLQLEKSSSAQKILENSLEAKTEEMNKLQVKFNETVAAKDATIQGLEQTKAKLIAKGEETAVHLRKIQNALKVKDEEISKLGQLNKEFDEKEKIQANKISVQTGQIQSLQSRVEELDEKVQESEISVSMSQSELKGAQEKIVELQDTLAASKSELKQTTENFENELKGLRVSLLEKEAAMEEKSKELTDLKQTMQEELTNLRNKMSSLENELVEKKNELDSSCHTINELTEQRNEADQKLQLLQSQIDGILQQKLQLEQTCAKNEEEKSQLLEKLIANESEAKTLNSTIDEVTRRKDDAMAALQELGRENQSLQIEIAKIQGRKWADDSNVSNCSSCRKEFTLTFRKHHCRHCGQIFCSECSSKSASVPSSKKPVRVCDPCFTKLTTQ